jgi:flagellar biosynthesis/type III secretory pathway chaperone
MSQEPVRALAAVLAAQEAALETLVGILEDHQRLLLHPDPSALLPRLSVYEHLVGQIAMLEQARLKLTEQLAIDLGVDVASLTLSRLSSLFPARPENLPRLHRSLAALVRRVSDLNVRNAFLAERSLGYVERLLDQFVAALAPAPTYGAEGRARVGTGTAALLDREA